MATRGERRRSANAHSRAINSQPAIVSAVHTAISAPHHHAAMTQQQPGRSDSASRHDDGGGGVHAGSGNSTTVNATGPAPTVVILSVCRSNRHRGTAMGCAGRSGPQIRMGMLACRIDRLRRIGMSAEATATAAAERACLSRRPCAHSHGPHTFAHVNDKVFQRAQPVHLHASDQLSSSARVHCRTVLPSVCSQDG